MKIPTIFTSLLKLAQKPQKKKMQSTYKWEIHQKFFLKNAFASFEMIKIFLI